MLRTIINNAIRKVTFRQQSLCKYENVTHNQQSSGMSSNNLDLEVNRIVWFDLEMTGLNVEQDKILEIACLVTDSDLNIIAEGPNIILHQPESILDNMDQWCIKQHGKSGLTEASHKSNINEAQAEREIMAFLKKYIAENVSPIAGNSVYMDRLFIIKFMPNIDRYLHYRLIDVSTIKELCRRWNSNVYSKAPKKQFTHRALDDIKESVNELKYYKMNFFNSL